MSQQYRIPCFNEVIVAINGNNELDMFISMRANDAYNYFGGTNFFVWSVILEIMSNWLKVKPGKYYLFVGSMEIFERDFEKSMRLCNNHLEYCSNSGLKKRMQGITIACNQCSGVLCGHDYDTGMVPDRSVYCRCHWFYRTVHILL